MLLTRLTRPPHAASTAAPARSFLSSYASPCVHARRPIHLDALLSATETCRRLPRPRTPPMKPEIVVLRSLYEPTLAVLEREFTVRKSYTAPDPISYIKQHCANARAAISTTTTGPRRKDEMPYPYYNDLEALARDARCVCRRAACARGIAANGQCGACAAHGGCASAICGGGVAVCRLGVNK